MEFGFRRIFLSRRKTGEKNRTATKRICQTRECCPIKQQNFLKSVQILAKPIFAPEKFRKISNDVDEHSFSVFHSTSGTIDRPTMSLRRRSMGASTFLQKRMGHSSFAGMWTLPKQKQTSRDPSRKQLLQNKLHDTDSFFPTNFSRSVFPTNFSRWTSCKIYLK